MLQGGAWLAHVSCASDSVACSTCLRVVARQGSYARICATHQISRGAGEKRYSGRRARTVHCCKLGSSVHEHADHNGPAVAAESESFRCLRVLARRGRRRRRGRDRARGPAADGAARRTRRRARARKTQQDASLAARIARDDRKRGGGRGGGRGRIAAAAETAKSPRRQQRGRLRLRRRLDDEGESRYGRGRAAAAPQVFLSFSRGAIAYHGHGAFPLPRAAYVNRAARPSASCRYVRWGLAGPRALPRRHTRD